MTDKEKQEIAEKAGHFYRFGLELGKLVKDLSEEIDRLMAQGMTYDEAAWITLHPNGALHKGVKCLIDTVSKVILGGLGGKFTGMKLGNAFKKTVGRILKRKREKTKNEGKKEQTAWNANSNNTPEPQKQPPKEPREVKAVKVNGDTPVPKGFKGIERVHNGSIRLNSYHAEDYHNSTSFKGRSPEPSSKYKEARVGDKTYEALRHYSYKGDEEMNGYLRNGIMPKDPKVLDEIKAIDEYMAKNRTKGSMKLFRGMQDPEKAKEFIRTGIYSDPGYASTSTSFGAAHKRAIPTQEKDQYILVLNTPHNYGAVSLKNKNVSKFKAEDEILLQRNGKGTVKKVEKFANRAGKDSHDYYIYIDLDAD